MTSSDLTWSKAKDMIVVGIGGLLVALLVAVLDAQQKSSVVLAELRRDVAVLTSEKARDREETKELKDRVARLEARR